MGLLKAIRTGWDLFFGKQSVASVADEYIHTDEEKAGEMLQDQGQAMQFYGQPATQPGIINQLVDAFNRLIRPGVTVWLIGGFCGWWTLPSPSTIDPLWFQVFMIVVTFWFGGRVIMRDLPNLLTAWMNVKRARRDR